MGTTAAAVTATESEDAPQAGRHDCTCRRLASRSEPFLSQTPGGTPQSHLPPD
jgi:hypothetical protein